MTLKNWDNPVPAGYTRAANVVVKYDVGYHTFYGRLLTCDICGSVVAEPNHKMHDNWHEKLDLRLADLNQS
jgi:hypothetical protein